MSMKSLLRAVLPARLARLAGQTKLAWIARNESVSFSAYGEDLVILSWLRRFGCDLTAVRYLDVGAADPIHLSNTFLLYCAGARGVLVEPDPDQAAALRRARPRDVVINAGAAFDERRSAKYFRMTSSVFNSFSEEQATRVAEMSKTWAPGQRQDILATIEVPLVPVNDIIRAHLPGRGPDFISVDVEGAELAIARTIDFALMNGDPKTPAFFCIEALAKLRDLKPLLDPHGFKMIARTADNWVFRRHPHEME